MLKHLPKSERKWVRKVLWQAWHLPDVEQAEQQLRELIAELDPAPAPRAPVFVKRKVGHSVHRKLGHPFCHGFYSHPFVWPDGARGTGRLIAYRDRRAGPRKGKFGRRPHHGVKAAAA